MSRFVVLLVVVAVLGCTRNIPVPDVKASAAEAHVARGRYLANNAMSCVVCHSRRDWTKFGGPVVEGSEFGGSGDIPVVEGWTSKMHFGAQNLTPQHLADWSDGEIVRATLLGQSKDTHGLFPYMPYRTWRDAVPLEDATDIVAYLRTLSPIAQDAPERDLPIPTFVLNRLPEPRELKASAPKPSDPGYGAYVTARARCVECHTEDDRRGNYTAPLFSGGREFAVPPPGKGFVRSSNLTPDPDTGLGGMTREAFVARFKAMTLEAARASTVGDDGYNSVMAWWAYSGLTEEDLGAVFDYLKSLPPVKNNVEKWSLTSKEAK